MILVVIFIIIHIMKRHYRILYVQNCTFPMHFITHNKNTTPHFNMHIAKWAASSILFINRSRASCRRHVHSMNIMGARAIFFTGTCGINEWIDGLRLCTDAVENHYHPGWKRLYDSEQAVADAASAPTATDNTGHGLWLFGYSLGGALATIHAAELARRGMHGTINGLYTFGSPRVCDRETAHLLDATVPNNFRVSNTYDPVVRLPPEFMGYCHTGREVSVSFVDPLCSHTLYNYCKHV